MWGEKVLPGTMFGHQTAEKLVWHNIKSSMKGKKPPTKESQTLRMYMSVIVIIHTHYAFQWGWRREEIRTAFAQEDTFG